MSQSLDGYAVLITGGSTGAKVAITDFKQANLDQAAIELKRDGVEPLCLKADNRLVGEVKAAAATAEAQFGKVDILVNNAGISGMMAHVEDVDEAFFDSLF